MEEKPKISIIAPCLNEEKHLPTFLNSLTKQTFKDFEVIIIDGESKDKSLEIIEAYKSKLNINLIIDTTRNFGFLRNLGASKAKGTIHFHGNTDTYFEPNFFKKLNKFYREHYETIAVAGRVYPMGTSFMAKIAYPAFDFFRFVFTCYPFPIRKFRPSGSFTSCRKWAFEMVNGYPEATVNEDGLFGQRLDAFAAKCHRAVVYNLKMWVGHHVKKFEKMGGLNAFLFYLYTLGNFAPILKPLLKPIENYASQVFQGKEPVKLTFKMLVWNFWDWL